MGHQRGEEDDGDALLANVTPDERERRQEHEENRDLPELDPEVEREQRNHQVPAGELEILPQSVGEPETVDEAEQPRDQPTAAQARAPSSPPHSASSPLS